MEIIGLTGGIGCGKSTISKMFLDNNIPVIDTDRISKKFYTSLSFQKKLIDNFKGITTNKEFDKQKLRELVFNNKNELEALNRILIPLIIEEVHKELKDVDNNIVLWERVEVKQYTMKELEAIVGHKFEIKESK